MPNPKATLEIFIPEDRRQALSRGETLPVRAYGAVLFADLSGFTKLTNELSSLLGPLRGAEELTHQLDPIYTELIDAVHNYGGSVIGISGDGITCWFDQDEGMLSTTCAVVMQQIMSQHENIVLPSHDVFSLGIRISVCVGSVLRFLVGNPEIQLLETLAGQELTRVVLAQDLINRGEIVIGTEVYEKIADRIQNVVWRLTPLGEKFAVISGLTELAQPAPWPIIPELDKQVAKKWVYPPIYERIQGEELEYLTELRSAVPLFLKFNGINYDEDTLAEQKLDQFIKCVQSILTKYEGYLCHLTIGDKGSNLYISFGAPIAHEDSINRALAAALRLRQEISELGFIKEIQIGLTHGKVWAGAHGGKMARTYSIIGTEVNLAARLMSQAEAGQILVSPHVAESTSNYSFIQMPPIELKGIAKPMSPSLLIGRTKAQIETVRQNILLGRTQERTLIQNKLRKLVDQDNESSGVIVIEGDAGIGKSRLLAEMTEQANQMGIKVLYGKTDPVERTTQYYAIRPIIENIFDISELEDSQLIQEKVRSIVEKDEFLAERAPLLNEILPLRWPDNSLTIQMSGEARATSIREVLLRIIQKFLTQNNSPSPTMVIFDDAQWMDAATWGLVGYINRDLNSILIAIATRPISPDETSAQIEDELGRILLSDTTEHLQLSSLGTEEISELVSQRLGLKNIPQSILEFIKTRSQGNPFFSEELAYALRDANIIQVIDGKAYIDQAAEELARIDFPETVQGVVTRRINRLPATHQLTLKVASVIGRIFFIGMLTNVHPGKVNQPILEEYLQYLTQLGITDLDSPDPELAYFFKHVITQEVVYGLMTFSQRKQLHCAIAEWYEKTYSEDLTPYYSRLAHHWLRGESREKAIYFLDKAAEQSLKLFSNEDTIRFSNIAIDLDKALSASTKNKNTPLNNLKRARRERIIGTAYFRIGKLPESQTHLSHALELLGRPIPDSTFNLTLELIKELLKQIFHRLFPSLLQKPLKQTQQSMIEELAKVEIESLYYYAQNTGMLAWGILRRLNLAERAQMPSQMAEGYGNLQMITGLAGLESIYKRYKSMMHASIAEANNIPVQIFLFLRESVVDFIRCNWETAYKNLETGISLADQLGDTRQWSELSATLNTCLYLQSKFEQSKLRWKELYQRAARSDSPQNQAWGLYGQGHNALMLGNIGEAINLLEASINIPMKNADDKILDLSRHGALCLAYFRSANYKKCINQVQRFQELAPSKPGISSTMTEYDSFLDTIIGLWSKVQLGDLHISEKEKTNLELLFKKVPQIALALRQLPVNQAKSFLYEGIHQIMMNKNNLAVISLKKCIESADLHQQPYEIGRAYMELSKIVSRLEKEVYLQNASLIFSDLHTPYELNLTLTMLEKLI
ncbi:MAG: adenylate/guanylate cyclase domain-containing protein [Anaerolineales bacterium]